MIRHKIAAALIFLVLPIFAVSRQSSADTVHFKNGRSIEGIVKKKSEDTVEIYVGFGSITCRKDQIKKIDCSTEEERAGLYKKWTNKREELSRIAPQPAMEDRTTTTQAPPQTKTPDTTEKSVVQSNAIIVDALLNDRVRARLVLDTGASLVVLSKKMGERLGLDLRDNKNNGMILKLAGDKTISAKMVFLDSVVVQHKEVNKVMAAVLTEDYANPYFNDGLLGMTFLSQFHFKIDPQNKTVKLEPIY